MPTIEEVASDKIFSDSKEILILGLSGVTAKRAFDVGKVDYVIDRNELSYRIEQITRRIIALAIPVIKELIEEEIEARVRAEIRSRI